MLLGQSKKWQMQPKWNRGPTQSRQRWRRRRWTAYVKLALILTFSAVLIFLGHRHRRAPNLDEPFPPTISGYGDPIDGDSLWVGDYEVRLKGIDAPEWKQDCRRGGEPWKCGESAREELVHAIGGGDVTCTISERDVYGRLLGRCTARGRDLNSGMVSAGMAIAFGGYWDEQAKARAGKRGIWASEFQEPRDWRADHAAGEER